MQVNECVFCNIAKGATTSLMIDSDREFVAFLDNNPFSEGHTLIVPRSHYKMLWDMPREEIGRMFIFAQKVAKKYQRITGNPKVYMLARGEDIEHAHIHIVPNRTDTFYRKYTQFFKELAPLYGNSVDKLVRIWQRYKS